MSGVVVGVDIGGTSTRAVACNQRLEVLDRRSARTPATAGDGAMLAAAAALIEDLDTGVHGPVRAIGVGAAGIIGGDDGVVLAASDSFIGWVGTPIAARLSERFAVPVAVRNDVDAFLLGEAATGAAGRGTHTLGLMLGTGVGGAVIADERLVRGSHGAAGEIGHIPGFGDAPCTCGQRGHLETLASGRSIARRFAERSGRDLPTRGSLPTPGSLPTHERGAPTAKDVAALARDGDAVARRCFEDAGHAVGRGIRMVAGLLDIDTAVIGGGVGAAWDLLEPAVTEVLADEPPTSGKSVTVVRSGLGADAVAVGACAEALQIDGARAAGGEGPSVDGARAAGDARAVDESRPRPAPIG